MDAEQVLAFRLARSGLAERGARGLGAAAACPASDFVRDAALLALAARTDGLTREGYHAAVDDGELVVAHVVRGAIHVVARADHALYGRALLAPDDADLALQLGRQVAQLTCEAGIAPRAALEEVSSATEAALAAGGALDRAALHHELRRRVRPELMPWCRGCESHHVAPMLWRYATVAAGVRLDAARRYTAGAPGPAAPSSEALRRFLGFYGPATPGDFAEWAGIAGPHARRVWDEVAGELAEVPVAGRRAWLLSADTGALASPPAASGVRLLPPGDPYLQKPNRSLLAPDPGVRKRLFRPVASPGAVLSDGRLAGLWRVRAKGRTAEVAVEALGPLRRAEVEEEAQRVAHLRGAREAAVVVA